MDFPLLQLPHHLTQPAYFSEAEIDLPQNGTYNDSDNGYLETYSPPHHSQPHSLQSLFPQPHFVQPYENLMEVLQQIGDQLTGSNRNKAVQHNIQNENTTDDCIFPQIPLLQLESFYPISNKERNQPPILPLLQWGREEDGGLYQPNQPNLLSPDLLFHKRPQEDSVSSESHSSPLNLLQRVEETNYNAPEQALR